jgi:RAT1-interacting protein
LKYYYTPSLPADLSAGYDRFHRWDESIDEHLDGLLRSIQLLEEKTQERLKVDVITWRGMMTKVVTSDPVSSS